MGLRRDSRGHQSFGAADRRIQYLGWGYPQNPGIPRLKTGAGPPPDGLDRAAEKGGSHLALAVGSSAALACSRDRIRHASSIAARNACMVSRTVD